MRPVRLTRAQQQALTRERLLAAAERVLAGHGYGGASIDLITAEAGYSKGAIYSNFESKEAVFLELLRNPAFAKRYYALQDQQTGALARILERFFEAQSVPLPMDPRDLAGCMTALARLHGARYGGTCADRQSPSAPAVRRAELMARNNALR